MSTALAGSSVEASPETLIEDPAGDASAELGDAAERGSLTIDDRVVERVAGHAVTLVEGASAAPRRVLGVTVGEARADTEASVEARVDGHTATIDATVAIGWPASIGAVSARLRERIRQDVERMTGVRVDHIDIDVVSLSAPAATRRRVL